MSINMTTERGLESALSACPRSAAISHRLAGPRSVAPIQGGLGGAVRPRTAAVLKSITATGMYAADFRAVVTPVQQFVQLVPIDPGALTRRPPA